VELSDTLADIWRRLARATADRRAAWRTPVLATLGIDGAPRARTLVLRAADQAAATLTLHTDARSAKAAELGRDARAALLFWDPRALVQLRAEGTASLAPDPAAFAALPAGGRAVYAVAPAPGTPIAAPDAVATADPAAAFRVLTVRVATLEWLALSTPHRRARFDLAGGGATWLVP
jgi:hypothetical protein